MPPQFRNDRDADLRKTVENGVSVRRRAVHRFRRARVVTNRIAIEFQFCYAASPLDREIGDFAKESVHTSAVYRLLIAAPCSVTKQSFPRPRLS